MSDRDSGDRSRSSGRRTFLGALGLLPFWLRQFGTSARAQSVDVFQGGWNHPWIGYGHDFGRAWGHDGLSTSGWTCETYPTMRAFVESEITADPETGRGALRIGCDLAGDDADRSAGAVHVSLVDHWPSGCPPPAGAMSVNLDGALARCRIRLPRGGAGPADAPNRLQLILKTRLSAERWPSMQTAPVSVSPAWEGRYVDVLFRLDRRDAAHADLEFDLARVSLIGLTMSAGSPAAAIAGPIWVEEVALETDPPLLFDFERTECDAQLALVRRRAGRAWSLVRFFVFCDGRAAPTFAPDGTVVGIDSAFYRDFDVLLRAAERHRVALMPVLLDFGWCAHPRTVSGVRLGGHADVIRQADKRRAFLERALRPLLERYGRHPAIFAWDVCNEPEWVIGDIPDAQRQRHEVVSLADMRAFVGSCAAYVHRLTPTQLVTLGSARRKWLSLWKGCDLDLYQFHWYDHFQRDERFPWGSYEELDLDRPCLIGEVPTDRTAFTPQEFVAAAQAGGYSGLLFWSYGARDAHSDLCSILEERRRPRPRDVSRS